MSSASPEQGWGIQRAAGLGHTLTFSQGLLQEVVLGLQLGDQVPAFQVFLHFLWKKHSAEWTSDLSGLLGCEHEGRMTLNLQSDTGFTFIE